MPYTIPARVSERGRHVPEIIVDDEFATAVGGMIVSVKKGYPTASVNGKTVYLHRHLWFLRFGNTPDFIDHINGNKLDSRIENLRPASKRLNALNKHRKRSDAQLDLPIGVFFTPKTSKGHPSKIPYRSHIMFDGRSHYLGNFATPEEASAVYQAMKFMLILVESALCQSA
jgi:hypothetical protein